MRAVRTRLMAWTAIAVVAMAGCATPTARTRVVRARRRPAATEPAPAAEPVVDVQGAQIKMRALSGDCRAEFTGTCYPVWFGTDRKPLDPRNPALGFGPEPDGKLHFGKRIVRIPISHRPGELGSPLWRRLLTGVDDRITVDPATVLSDDAFTRDIRAFLTTLDPADRNVLVFIHGFNTTFDNAAKRAAQLGFDLRVPGITAFYSWPSLGNITAYMGDVARMEASEQHLADFLVKTTTLVERGKVHLIAHSMGNRGLLNAMHRATTQAALRTGTKFGQIFLAAPDIDARSFAPARRHLPAGRRTHHAVRGRPGQGAAGVGMGHRRNARRRRAAGAGAARHRHRARARLEPVPPGPQLRGRRRLGAARHPHPAALAGGAGAPPRAQRLADARRHAGRQGRVGARTLKSSECQREPPAGAGEPLPGPTTFLPVSIGTALMLPVHAPVCV